MTWPVSRWKSHPNNYRYIYTFSPSLIICTWLGLGGTTLWLTRNETWWWENRPFSWYMMEWWNMFPLKCPLKWRICNCNAWLRKGSKGYFICAKRSKPWSKHGFYVVVIHPTRNPNIIYIYIYIYYRSLMVNGLITKNYSIWLHNPISDIFSLVRQIPFISHGVVLPHFWVGL